MAVAKDGAGVSTGGNAATLTTGNYSTSANSLIVVALCIDCQSGFDPIPTSVTSAAAGALTLIVSQTSTAQFAGLYVVFTSGALTNDTVTANWTNSGIGMLAVQPFTGSQTYSGLVAGTDYATATATANPTNHATLNITTKKDGSWIVAGANAFSSNSQTPDTNSGTLFQYFFGGGNGGSVFLERTDSPKNIGTYDIGTVWSASDGWDEAAMEIIPAAATVGNIAWIKA